MTRIQFPPAPPGIYTRLRDAFLATFVAAKDSAKKRFKVLNTSDFAVNFGLSVARNTSPFATWRYEVYLSFWTRTLRIGVKRVTLPLVTVLSTPTIAIEGGHVTDAKETVTLVDEYAPDEANERP